MTDVSQWSEIESISERTDKLYKTFDRKLDKYDISVGSIGDHTVAYTVKDATNDEEIITLSSEDAYIWLKLGLILKFKSEINKQRDE